MAAAAPLAAYVLRTGADRAPAGLNEEDTISQTLNWIGFVRDADRDRIMVDSLDTYTDIKMLSEKDVTAMAEDYQRRPAAERIVFGARRTKFMKALTHWIHDFYRVSETPTVNDMNQQDFRDQLLRALA
jgi:uncharacterized hydantoinase/oxoprolinase family protein